LIRIFIMVAACIHIHTRKGIYFVLHYILLSTQPSLVKSFIKDLNWVEYSIIAFCYSCKLCTNFDFESYPSRAKGLWIPVLPVVISQPSNWKSTVSIVSSYFTCSRARLESVRSDNPEVDDDPFEDCSLGICTFYKALSEANIEAQHLNRTLRNLSSTTIISLLYRTVPFICSIYE
jgi:hypothetical protein